MRRWHQEYFHMYNEWKKHRDHRLEFNCDYFKNIGHFRKKKSLDCGKTHCYLCHSDKFPVRQLTKQELIAKLNKREQR